MSLLKMTQEHFHSMIFLMNLNPLLSIPLMLNVHCFLSFPKKRSALKLKFLNPSLITGKSDIKFDSSFNFKELRKALKTLLHIFKCHSILFVNVLGI